MKKFKFLALALVLVVGLSGCTKKEELNTELEGERIPVSGFENEGTGETANVEGYESGPVPGTQQDLVVNIGDRVFYDYDQHALRADARATVERQARWMNQHPSLNVVIEGHCDERGTREYNLALGEKRAEAVKNYMIALGVDPSRLEVLSYGKERPAALGSNPSAWAQNRRGVVILK